MTIKRSKSYNSKISRCTQESRLCRKTLPKSITKKQLLKILQLFKMQKMLSLYKQFKLNNPMKRYMRLMKYIQITLLLSKIGNQSCLPSNLQDQKSILKRQNNLMRQTSETMFMIKKQEVQGYEAVKRVNFPIPLLLFKESIQKLMKMSPSMFLNQWLNLMNENLS